jgi:site-specific DNA-methyltransferase (adenine-specific)
MNHQVITGDCLDLLENGTVPPGIALTFLDPPFNQGKKYKFADDKLEPKDYWRRMRRACSAIYDLTQEGGAIYFMQREKNAEQVLKTLRKTGWDFRNLIVWKRVSGAMLVNGAFMKQYQIIAYATKGKAPRVFARLRIDPPLPHNYKIERERGVYLTDVWDDVKELTAGVFAPADAIRKTTGARFHEQQSPITLLLRILLSSTIKGDRILDPYAGTGTAAVVAKQLNRESVSIEIDPENVRCIKYRLEGLRDVDNIEPLYASYAYTPRLATLWGLNNRVDPC